MSQRDMMKEDIRLILKEN